MAEKKTRKREDLAQLAKRIVDQSTDEERHPDLVARWQRRMIIPCRSITTEELLRSAREAEGDSD